MQMLRSVGPMLLIVSGLLLVSACGDDHDDTTTNPPPEAVDTSNYQLPLSVGNEWVYERTTAEGRIAATPQVTYTARVVGTREIDGLLYSAYFDTTSISDTTYIRQDQSEVLSYLGIFLDEPTHDEITELLVEVLGDTAPWKLADFAAEVGDPWEVVRGQSVVTYVIGVPPIQFEALVTVLTTAENLDPETVTVPAGTFQDAYHVRIRQVVDAAVGGSPFPLVRSTQDAYIADGVGIVKTFEESVTTVPTQEPETLITSTELISYTVR